jgi:hypothetical protein
MGQTMIYKEEKIDDTKGYSETVNRRKMGQTMIYKKEKIDDTKGIIQKP